jgi:hypothetical protein
MKNSASKKFPKKLGYKPIAFTKPYTKELKS